MASDAAKGTFHPPRSSRGVAAECGVSAAGEVTVTGADGRLLASATARAVNVSDRIGSIPRRIAFTDGSVFETTDNDTIDRQFAAFGPRVSRFVSGLERVRPRMALFVVAVVVLGTALYRFAVPALVEVAVVATPPVVPRLIGRTALASLDKTVFAPSELDAKRQLQIADDFNTLADLAPGGRDAFHLDFRFGGPVGPNAFALPDGSIVVTDELIGLAERR